MWNNVCCHQKQWDTDLQGLFTVPSHLGYSTFGFVLASYCCKIKQMQVYEIMIILTSVTRINIKVDYLWIWSFSSNSQTLLCSCITIWMVKMSENHPAYTKSQQCEMQIWMWKCWQGGEVYSSSVGTASHMYESGFCHLLHVIPSPSLSLSGFSIISSAVLSHWRQKCSKKYFKKLRENAKKRIQQH